MFSPDRYYEQHGGANPRELLGYGINPNSVIDFSVNSNPFGPAKSILSKLNDVDISKYPDPDSFLARNALATHGQVATENILIGNGTSELIWLCVQALIQTDGLALILGPTFGEYRRALEAAGAEIEEIRANPPGFEPPLEMLIERIRTRHPRLVFFCNPNNPTGTHISDAGIQEISRACGSETILVIDEAYSSFVHGHRFNPLPSVNCLILRSMTKDFALAGLRLGYCLGDRTLIKKLQTRQPAWSVNALAQAVVPAVLDELPYYQSTFRRIDKLKAKFFGRLQDIGIQINGSTTHYGIFPTIEPARHVRELLLRQKLQVRDCNSFGLPNYIRVSTQLESNNEQLIVALKNLLKDKLI